jgi:LmbE family N-acetylglucosaminyl deacetylase
MKPTAPLALALLAATAFAHLEAQSPATFTDPANLRGERPAPLTGRELPIDQGALGLQQLLRKLNTRASIMNIVAHPDDEDGGMMAFYSRGLGARVADLSLTRGEGGQNAVTGDFEDALGLLRTQELLSCDRYSGVDQFFGTEVDFGFSKTKEEAFAKWTHERVLYDVVRAIRLYRPLVLTSTWVGGVTDGHGQHQVSGQIAQEAFVAAGDPKVFPELTAEGIFPWQPLRIYARVPMQSISEKGLFDYATGQYTPAKFTNYVTGEVTTTPPTTDVIVHEGTQDPLLTHAAANPSDIRSKATLDPDTPFTYVQFARIGLGLQKSQVGPGVRTPPPGAFDVAYHLYGSHVPSQNVSSRPERSAVERPAAKAAAASSSPFSASNSDPTFFTGIDTSLEGIATLVPNAPNLIRDPLRIIAESIQIAQRNFDPAHPEACAKPLAEATATLDLLIEAVGPINDIPVEQKQSLLHELRIKRAQLNNAIALSLGVTLDAQLNDPTNPLVAGQAFAFKAELRYPGSTTITHPRFVPIGELPGQDLEPAQPTVTPTGISETFALRSGIIKPTRPYFSRRNVEQPFYDVANPRLRLAPATPSPLAVIAAFNYQGVEVDLTHTTTSIHRYPTGETISQPAAVIPPVSITLASHANVVPHSTTVYGVAAEVRNMARQPISGVLHLGAPSGWTVVTSAVPFKLPALSEPFVTIVKIRENPPSMGCCGPLSDSITASIRTATSKNYDEGYRPVGYPGLPDTNYYTPATDRVVPIDLKLPIHHNIAYLPGTGDSIPETLTSIGLTPTTLSVSDLTLEHLKQFDTVILGVRTYNAHPDLHGAPTRALLDYARNGGNVVVQYQTTEFTGDDAPYPLSLGSNEKVVDEAAPVHLLSTNAPQLTTPNTITSADFNGWIEERGHGFLSTWDPKYIALTETHDPGQAAQRGGLITTQLGKGRWTYVSFALYRQLPEAVPGAYRLFLNLLNP